MLDPVNFLIVLRYVALIAVVMVVLAPTPVHMVFFGVAFYISFGCFFVALGCDFLGVILIIVYAGALMVMFLFVIMAFDLARSPVLLEIQSFSFRTISWVRLVFYLLSAGFIFQIVINRDFLAVLLDETCFFIDGGSNRFFSITFFFMSVLPSLGFVLYQNSFSLLIFCGVFLCLSFIGAVGLTYGTNFLPLKRRHPLVSRYPLSLQRRIILLTMREGL